MGLTSGAAILLAAWLLAVNAATYLAFRQDKQAAIAGERRTPEQRLLLLAALGGSPAAVLAQRTLRHKTRKQPFATLLLLIAGLQAAGAAWLLLRR